MDGQEALPFDLLRLEPLVGVPPSIPSTRYLSPAVLLALTMLGMDGEGETFSQPAILRFSVIQG